MRPTLTSLLAFALACGASPQDVDQTRVLGTIAGFTAEDPRIQITTAGREATVAVTTYGGGCDSQGDTEAEVSDLEAVVTPYDYARRPGASCTRLLRTFRHETTIRFERSGLARVIVQGLEAPSGDTLRAERSVSVQ